MASSALAICRQKAFRPGDFGKKHPMPIIATGTAGGFDVFAFVTTQAFCGLQRCDVTRIKRCQEPLKRGQGADAPVCTAPRVSDGLYSTQTPFLQGLDGPRQT
jgi:hypothetical protein